jgi:CRISPR-associated protein Csx17
LPLRSQIFPVQREFDRWMTPEAAEAARIHASGSGRLTNLLAAWLDRRLWLMHKLDLQDKPLSSPAGAMPEDVAAFLNDPRMDTRILALLPGLSLCEIPLDPERGAGEGRLPAAFGLMKLALTPDRDLRSLGHLAAGEHMPVPRGLPATLMAGNPGNRAVALAWRRLRASGLTPRLDGALPALAGIDSNRAVAALLIPLCWAATAALARSLLQEPEARTSSASTTD